jgi:hypothetical protein
MDVLLAEADPRNARKKKNTQPYTGRDRDQIEKEVLELLGQKGIQESESESEDDEDEPQPSTSRQGLNQVDEESSEPSTMDESGVQAHPAANSQQMEQDPLASGPVEATAIETYTLIDDGSGGPAIWTTDNGESVVVTIEEDGQGGLVATTGVQQDLHDIIQGEMLMLE